MKQRIVLLWGKIPNAVRAFFQWAFPFIAAGIGITLIAVAAAGSKPGWLLFGLGTVMILGAMDTRERLARSLENDRWAKLIAGMIADERKVKINVNHTWESMRPHLDSRIEELVAQAIAAEKDTPDA